MPRTPNWASVTVCANHTLALVFQNCGSFSYTAVTSAMFLMSGSPLYIVNVKQMNAKHSCVIHYLGRTIQNMSVL